MFSNFQILTPNMTSLSPTCGKMGPFVLGAQKQVDVFDKVRGN